MATPADSILIVAAHPDDEVLGAGGTLLKHRDAGDALTILLLANGEDARDRGADAAKRFAQAREVARRLNAKLVTENFPDNAFDSVPLLQIAKAVEKTLFSVNPSIVYTHHPYDLNIDHRLACAAVMTACRPQPPCTVKKILAFETPSSSEWQLKNHESFKPAMFRDIASVLEEKLDLAQVYRDELRPYPHPRSIDGLRILAQYRGLEVGLKAAEAFEVLRTITD